MRPYRWPLTPRAYRFTPDERREMPARKAFLAPQRPHRMRLGRHA